MIAVDTNILVYAHRQDSPWNKLAASALRGLAEGASQWSITWQTLSEFYSVVTHPRVYSPPSTPDEAIGQIGIWLKAPGLVLLSESGSHWPVLAGLLRSGKVSGPAVHDARIAALCIENGVSEIWTADRDFSRFPGLKSRNPLVS